VLTPVIRPIKHSEILPAHVHPVKELGQSQVHVWISSIRPIKHAEILPAHIHPVKELGQSQVHVLHYLKKGFSPRPGYLPIHLRWEKSGKN
jgi:hypothetical protein